MRIKVTGKRAEIIERSNPLTVGQKGEQIAIEFSADWDGLTKTAQFYNGETLIDALVYSDSVEIPAEMAVSKRPVSVCFIGKNADGTVVYPAVECPIGSVWYGERPGGEPPVPPTPDWKAQIEAGVSQANETADGVRADADAGLFDGEDGVTPHIGENGNWYIGTVDTGVKAAGIDGKTPVRGVDYYTDADKQAIVDDVLATFPVWNWEAV